MVGKYKLIGICVSKIQEEYRLHCIEALNRYACEKGYRLLIFNVCSDLYFWENSGEPGEAAIFQLIQYDMLDAMVLFSETLKNEQLCKNIVENCHKYHILALSVDYPLEGCINFSFDYANTFEAMCRHVVEDHHVKRVFMMAGGKGNRFSEERGDAFRSVLAENQIPFSDEIVAYGDFWGKPTLEAMQDWFEVKKLPIPEAIICANDTMAVVVSQYLQDHGYRVPDDCIVTGFDGIMQAGYHIPHMTTCTQDYDEMGRLMVEVIEKSRNGIPCEKNYTVAFRIIRSQSCGCTRDMDVSKINKATQLVLDRLLLTKGREETTCQLQTAVTNMNSLEELPNILSAKFVFHTMVFAVNESMFQPPEFGAKHDAAHPFSENVNILYHRIFWTPNESSTIPYRQIAPKLEELLRREIPVVCCSLHFMDLIMGYCVFQMEIDSEEYEKMQSFMNAINSSLGIYRSQLHVKSVNTQLKNVNQQLEKLYIHDHLTGLLNRRGFYQYFLSMISDNRGKSMHAVLISADLDGLKYINDTFGHLEGDNAITVVGHALAASAVQGEVCSRFGGDEFVVAGIVPRGEQSEYFENFSFRFHEFLRNYNEVSHKSYQVESSIGFCMEPLTENLDLDQLIKIADDQMYRDKIARKKNRT